MVPMVLLRTETYRRLIQKTDSGRPNASEQFSSPDKPEPSDNASGKSHMEETTAEERNDTTQDTDYSEQDIKNCVDQSSSLGFHLDELLQAIKSSTSVGKLVALWQYLLHQRQLGRISWNTQLELTSKDGETVQKSNILKLIRYMILSPKAKEKAPLTNLKKNSQWIARF